MFVKYYIISIFGLFRQNQDFYRVIYMILDKIQMRSQVTYIFKFAMIFLNSDIY